MENLPDFEDEAEINAENEAMIRGKLKKYKSRISKMLKDLRTIKKIASARSNNDPSGSRLSRLNVIDEDINNLEKVINGSLPIEAFWAAIDKLISDIDFLSFYSYVLLTVSAKEKTDKIYQLLLLLNER